MPTCVAVEGGVVVMPTCVAEVVVPTCVAVTGGGGGAHFVAVAVAGGGGGAHVCGAGRR